MGGLGVPREGTAEENFVDGSDGTRRRWLPSGLGMEERWAARRGFGVPWEGNREETCLDGGGEMQIGGFRRPQGRGWGELPRGLDSVPMEPPR